MIAWIAARTGIELSKTALLAIAVAGLLALAGLGFWRGLALLSGMVSDAQASARAERDAHWRAEIAASNALAEAERRRLVEEAAAADRRAAADLADLHKQLIDLEARNAALPNGAARGLGRDRVRLLNP